MPDFKCLECKFDTPTQRCHTNEVFDASKLAAAWLTYCQRFDEIDHVAVADKYMWAYECLFERIYNAPETAFEVLHTLIQQAKTKAEASSIAAGPLEDIISKHGETFIDRIEIHARQSLRFRYILSGVWPDKNNTDIYS